MLIFCLKKKIYKEKASIFTIKNFYAYNKVPNNIGIYFFRLSFVTRHLHLNSTRGIPL